MASLETLAKSLSLFLGLALDVLATLAQSLHLALELLREAVADLAKSLSLALNLPPLDLGLWTVLWPEVR